MKIVLMRHGEASFNAPNDNDRELTENGRLKIRFNVQQKEKELSRIPVFFSSPIRRALQTAKLTHELLKRQDEILLVDWLIHEAKPRDVITALGECCFDSVMLFSHQPLASHFVETLCGLERGSIAMNTASIIAMEVDPVAKGLGSVLWQLP